MSARTMPPKAKVKRCRRIATRYDKLAADYLAFIQLAASASGYVLIGPRPSSWCG
jgi:transposase